ncbi:DNA repair metallo-beta-lactamase-domain-containing protein [Lactarius deliciosus]|nr:DNA repair metallo-beta-lactamase-domain-containing protein [Lactarius deliciosus]
MTAVGAKRKVKVHAESCSDVEVVETDAQQTHVASSSRKKEKIEHGAWFVGSGIRIWALPLVHWQSWLPQTVTHEPPSASGDIALDQCLLVPPHNPTAAPRQSKCEGLADCDAFSDLMSSRKANEAWKEADMAGDRSFHPTKSNGGRKCTVLQDTHIQTTIRAFRRLGRQVRSTAPVSSEDSLVNLESNSFAEGTANLIIHMLSVDPKWVHPLPMDVPTMVPNSGGVTVTLTEANYSGHVGSARTFRYFHCGDFRASPQHTLHPTVKDKRIDVIYLDTTYLNPRAQVISACAELSRRLVSGKGSAEDARAPHRKSTGFDDLLGSTESHDPSVSIRPGTARNVNCGSFPGERSHSPPKLCHVRPPEGGYGTVERWNGHWTKVVAFRPTGWTYSPPAGTSSTPSVASTLARPPHREFRHAHLRPARGSTPSAQLFGMPYSEHSSFFELTYFALLLDWARIVPTVNVESAASRAKISTWIAR